MYWFFGLAYITEPATKFRFTQIIPAFREEMSPSSVENISLQDRDVRVFRTEQDPPQKHKKWQNHKKNKID